MLFNSGQYFLVFLPVVFFLFFSVAKFSHKGALIVLLVSSFVFYASWCLPYLGILIFSILLNFMISILILKSRFHRKTILFLGITSNLLLLVVFKYYGFFVESYNFFSKESITIYKLILPIGISFFTFQQISYLIDIYQNKVEEHSFLHYALFVSFFPQLIAGPIIHHNDVIPQYNSTKLFTKLYENITAGLLLFSIGLFKKAVVADYFASVSDAGYQGVGYLDSIEALLATLSYSMQIYFDFSGYTDMAIGSALLFNVKLPSNFNSPYKANNIKLFWKQWHITLSRWLSQYLYIPLGGNRKGFFFTIVNTLIVFLIGGFWHGANWTFILWGFSHGLAISIFLYYQKFNINLPKIFSWILTFLFVNFSWILFRADSYEDAKSMIRNLVSGGIKGFSYEQGITIILLLVALFIVTKYKNSLELVDEIIKDNKSSIWKLTFLFFFAVIGAYISLMSTNTVFLYFNF